MVRFGHRIPQELKRGSLQKRHIEVATIAPIYDLLIYWDLTPIGVFWFLFMMLHKTDRPLVNVAPTAF